MSIKYVYLPGEYLRSHKRTNTHSVRADTHTRIYNIQYTHTEFPWHMSSLGTQVKLWKQCVCVCVSVCVSLCVCVCVCVCESGVCGV